ncbi:leucyl/phenylalanyl-tRNA--protein transferase [Portibacter marinus]|uniref:leucyl/phenylalanyl-tRNA--protein transferase n=1 Tax=Portibacter marinus TaxID=2898660 RepID=UPI001F2BBD4D|nr:leucyl/phenylalanyl-tRNA--protein transferase [Portibacter marinus]
MPIFLISEKDPIFPDVALADEHGIIGIGGNLETSTLLKAYQSGIFPWYNEFDPILWWSPNPRFVLFPENLKVSKSMRPYFNQQKFRVSLDTHFHEVIKACQRIKRQGQNSTWITDEMLEAYQLLHQLGYAHSVEVWEGDQLAGGLYGVSLGRVFFGESMFTLRANASKFGFISLVRMLKERNFWMVDCQQETNHLRTMGAEGISRSEFVEFLDRNRKEPTLVGDWSHWVE